MQKFLKTSKPIIITFIVFLFGFFVFAPVVMAGDYGLSQTMNVVGNKIPKDTDIPPKIGKIVGAVLAFVGIIFFVLIIYGGFMWMTAGGDEQKVTKAKDLITQAVIGLIIVLAAYAITAFIGTVLTGKTS